MINTYFFFQTFRTLLKAYILKKKKQQKNSFANSVVIWNSLYEIQTDRRGISFEFLESELKWCATWEKTLMLYANSEGPNEHAHLCSLALTFSFADIYAIDSVSRQQWPRSACSSVQADQGLCCPQIA